MRKAVFIISLLFFYKLLFSQKQFFQPEKLVETGVYYYPEAWNPEQWERDFKKMSELGFEFTHFAEFAWAQLEPSEGVYDFKWLDKAVELAGKYKLKVILCTPVPTPPVWLTKKYPEVLLVLPNGQSVMHGSRAHYSWSSPVYQEFSKKIITALTKHYANNKNVWGWQIDNEPSHYGRLDYNPAAHTNFRQWLKNKYGSIDQLNNAWGTTFWSGTYTNFDQIELPNQGRMIGMASPTSLVDMKRFNADECAAFISMQNKWIKQNVPPTQFVTTNFMHEHADVDPWRNPDLDFISYTIYPVAGYTDGVGEQGFRMGDPWRISFANDFFRPFKSVTGIMELQPGQVNWGKYNPQPYPGAVRMWLWNAFAGGLDFLCTYRFRQPLYGGEQFHYGIVGTDGVTLSSGGTEFKQFMQEIRLLRKHYQPNAIMPNEYARRKTALVYNVDNVWETTIQPQTYQWSQMKHITKMYNAVKSLTIPVDIVSEKKSLSEYPFVIIPAFQMVDKQLIRKWTEYVREGGNLVMTVRTGLKDRNGHFPEASWAAMISQLIGGKIEMFDLMGDNKSAKVDFNEKTYNWSVWGDVIEPFAGTEIWARYADQFYAGKASVVHRRMGKGTVTYIGTDTNDGKFEKEVLKKLFATSGIPVMELPEGIIVNWRDGFWIANNYSSTTVTLDIPDENSILIGSKEIPPAGVLVWK